ncbi:hypothetical protein G9A89_002302 [Geosiphon pyriformis]|nr:hypothetical protein G9A89_002302 [Geosiphon pyriformis]
MDMKNVSEDVLRKQPLLRRQINFLTLSGKKGCHGRSQLSLAVEIEIVNSKDLVKSGNEKRMCGSFSTMKLEHTSVSIPLEASDILEASSRFPVDYPIREEFKFHDDIFVRDEGYVGFEAYFTLTMDALNPRIANLIRVAPKKKFATFGYTLNILNPENTEKTPTDIIDEPFAEFLFTRPLSHCDIKNQE